MQKHNYKKYLSLVLLLTSFQLLAQTPEEKGLQIAQASVKQDEGWGDMKADMKMILRNKHGQESVREISLSSLEQLDDGDKSLSVFNKPRDVKGTAFLSFSHPIGADDQWLYLPALKRVKRIASKNKSGPFMGSEFAFEDLSSFEVEKYTYKYLKDETINGVDSYVVEQVPVDENSGYTRRMVWIGKEHYRVQKIDFYDRKNSLLKTMGSSNYNQYLNKYWRPSKMEVTNHQSGKSTELMWSNYKFGVGLTDQDFNKNTLKRAR